MRTISRMDLTTTVSKNRLLEVLKSNREQHKKIVEEAHDGYIKAAIAQLTEKLESLKAGERVNLIFALTTPQDHTDAYDNTIQMVEWHTGEEISLTAEEFANFVRDDWEWTQGFVHSNKMYSSAAVAYGKSKNIT